MSAPELPRLERHLRETLRAQTQATRVGPYTLYYHPEAPYPELNVAVPDSAGEGRRIPVLGQEAAGLGAVPDDDPEYALMLLEAQFRARQRTPRIELLLEGHPQRAETLAKAGYQEVARVPLLACTSGTWKPAPDVPELRLEAVLPTTPWETTRAYLGIQREAYGLPTPVPVDAPRDAWPTLGIAAGVLARREGDAVGAGGITAPADGLCEVRGLAVAPRARRSGIGAALLASLARVAHEGGVEAVVATPDGPATARLARRVGYEPVATLVSYARAP